MSRHSTPLFVLVAAGFGVALGGCGSSKTDPPSATFKSRDELLDPTTCKECHAKHYGEWAGSMHAYASRDPVFLAMNRRGQEETKGVLGPFCVKCHAPMAVSEGLTTDGLNLGDPNAVPDKYQGITCFFCHSVESVEDTHNNPLKLATDKVMRGRFSDPVANPAHASQSSALLDGSHVDSAKMCGACHDIVLPSPPAPAPVALERTYSEWLTSVFTPANAPKPSAVSTCNACHLPPNSNPEPIAEGPNLKVGLRSRHPHTFAAVDVALDPFPSDDDDRETQLDRIQRLLDASLRFTICVRTGDTSSALYVTLDNASVGHNFPSGATQDRRAWLEITAYQNGDVIYQSGAVPDDQAVTDVGDPDLWILRDKALDAQGNEAHMFWDVASQVSGTVHVQTTSDPSDPAYYTVSHASRWFPLRPGTFAGIPDRVTARLRMRPLDLDVVDDLIATGHLDSTYRTQIPTFTLLPNKGLAVLPQYASMTSVSMEWSAAAKASPVFSHWPDETQGHPALDCVGMPKQP